MEHPAVVVQIGRMLTTASPIRPGQTVENPVTGERFTFIHTAASTGGELLAFDFALRPGGAVPIPHVHPIQTERFEVTAGTVRFRVGLRSVGSFTSSFTRTYGASPAAYRKSFPPAASRALVPGCVIRAYARPQRAASHTTPPPRRSRRASFRDTP